MLNFDVAPILQFVVKLAQQLMTYFQRIKWFHVHPVKPHHLSDGFTSSITDLMSTNGTVFVEIIAITSYKLHIRNHKYLLQFHIIFLTYFVCYRKYLSIKNKISRTLPQNISQGHLFLATFSKLNSRPSVNLGIQSYPLPHYNDVLEPCLMASNNSP